jgi:hypothetical protein
MGQQYLIDSKYSCSQVAFAQIVSSATYHLKYNPTIAKINTTKKPNTQRIISNFTFARSSFVANTSFSSAMAFSVLASMYSIIFATSFSPSFILIISKLQVQ